MNDYELTQHIAKEGGFLAYIELNFPNKPEEETWLRIWCADEDTKRGYLVILKDAYDKENIEVIFREATKIEYDFMNAVTALTNFPTWGELVQNKLLSPLIYPN